MARLNGNMSWENLLLTVYSKLTLNIITNSNQDSGLYLSPISLSASGNYGYSTGGLNNRSKNGSIWIGRSNADFFAYILRFFNELLSTGGRDGKVYGFSVRCGDKIKKKPRRRRLATFGGFD